LTYVKACGTYNNHWALKGYMVNRYYLISEQRDLEWTPQRLCNVVILVKLFHFCIRVRTKFETSHYERQFRTGCQTFENLLNPWPLNRTDVWGEAVRTRTERWHSNGSPSLLTILHVMTRQYFHETFADII
jgi:hypothetical protein